MDWMNSSWFWWGLALALFALEAVMPGTFMLWLGIAAIGTGIVHLLVPGLDPTMQWIAFAILSLLAVAVGWRYRQSHTPTPSDQPLLNRRAEQLIGRVYPLDTAIVDGRGRLKIGDAFWMVSGPDLAAGTRVRVIGVDGMELRIDPAG
jgi:inner membrane protein